jgi:hypothetical protein
MKSDLNITEDLLYYIWQSKLLAKHPLKTFDGNPLEIIDFGFRNEVSGPDFTGAKIKIGEILWAGNVEMHVKASDWHQHNHHNDKAYNNVILHIVWINDRHINIDARNQSIPALELMPLIDKEIIAQYLYLKQSKNNIPCANLWKDSFCQDLKFSLPRMAMGRLESKVKVFTDLLDDVGQNWNEALYIQITKYFGGSTNKATFERLGKIIPYSIFAKNAYDPLRVEAILFGISGLLQNENIDDEYYTALQREYQFQKSKYQFNEIYTHEWKFGKMLPAGFPTIRLAQLSAVMIRHQNIADKLLHNTELENIYRLFVCEANEYWNTHFLFGKEVKNKSTKPTKEFIDRIIINAVVPFYFAFGKLRSDEKYIDVAVEILDLLKSEKNSMVTLYKNLGFIAKTATESQGLIHLYQELCTKKKCTSCAIGRKIIYPSTKI